ncbi:MAG: hypothetical protein ACK56F_28835 [bacterium]
MVTSWNTLLIWFYEKCYLRFSGQDYEMNNIKNRLLFNKSFIHLTNNSIIKHHKDYNKSIIPGNMWRCS